MNDFEDKLRVALHEGADGVTEDTLRRPTLPKPRPSGVVVWLAAACCAVFVALVVPAIGYYLDASTPVPAAPSSYIGHRWLAESVERRGHEFPVPERLDASVTFDRGGLLFVHDSVNRRQGWYEAEHGWFSARDGGTTLRGYVGDDPVQLLIIDAMGALMTANNAEVTAAGDELTVDTGEFRIVFRRSAVQ